MPPRDPQDLGIRPASQPPAGEQQLSPALPLASAVATPGGLVTPAPVKLCPTCGGRYPQNFRVCPHDATPLSDEVEQPCDPLLGVVFADSYEVVQLIGEGGMGRVYEARHTRLRNKRFAIKVLLDEYARQPEVVARFEREAEAASAIAHPNVVAVYDVHRLEDGRPYIVAEYLEGQELGALLDRIGRLEPDTTVRIARQVCLALAAAHERGVVHRDMKPENVFLIGDPAAPLVKVLDFGISKQDDGRANLTRTGMVLGTPSYMAPEQARGQRVDARADVYAVGGILYRAVTGQPPYDGEDGATVLTKVLTEEPPRPREVNPDLPEPLELVIQRAMARDPAQRHASMQELETELAELDPHGPLPRASSTLLTRLSMAAAAADNRIAQASAGSAAAAPGSARATETAKQLRFVRPWLVLLSVVLYCWIGAGLIAIGADLLRWGGDQPQSLTGGEAVLLVIGALLALATPLVLWVRYLRRNVWRNTPRCLKLRGHLSAALTASIATYGMGALIAVVFESVVERLPLGSTAGLWGGTLFVPALLVGAASWLVRVQGWGKSA